MDRHKQLLKLCMTLGKSLHLRASVPSSIQQESFLLFFFLFFFFPSFSPFLPNTPKLFISHNSFNPPLPLRNGGSFQTHHSQARSAELKPLELSRKLTERSAFPRPRSMPYPRCPVIPHDPINTYKTYRGLRYKGRSPFIQRTKPSPSAHSRPHCFPFTPN